jgi:hypothetical protein
MKRSEQWALAASLDVRATALLRQGHYDDAHANFLSAFNHYLIAWNDSHSSQLLFEFAGFCWCLLEPGIPIIVNSEGLFQQCDQTCFDLISIGLKEYKDDKKIIFLKEYIDSQNGGYTTEEKILKTVDWNNPSDIPYFLLFILSDKKRYLENVKLLWENCIKERTLFNQLIISLIEHDCDPNLIEI